MAGLRPTPWWRPRGKSHLEQIAADRKLLTVPADPVESTKLDESVLQQFPWGHYGEPRRSSDGFRLRRVAERGGVAQEPDGTVSFTTITPGVIGFEFVVGSGPERTLIMRDAQHEYIFEEQRSSSD